MTAPDEAPLTFRVESCDAGKRLDKLVVDHLTEHGRRSVAHLFSRGAVHVGGRRVKKGDHAREGDIVIVNANLEVQGEPDATLSVVLETREFVVVSKPAGQATAPLDDGGAGTLAGALLGRYPEMAGVGYRAREPGLIHRLDTQTSGLVVAARSAVAFEHLRTALTSGHVEKHYYAVVGGSGLPEVGIVEHALEPSTDGRRVIVSAADSARRSSVTQYRVVRSFGEWALLDVSVRHAYRHQIRAHLAYEGHPIAGDSLYGGPEAEGLGARHALHASYVAWAGDEVVPGFEAFDPLPAALIALVGPG